MSSKKLSWVNEKTKKISWTKRRIELIFAIMHKRLSYDHERKGCEHVSGWLHFYRVLTYGDPYADLLTYNNSQWMCVVCNATMAAAQLSFMVIWKVPRRHKIDRAWDLERLQAVADPLPLALLLLIISEGFLQCKLLWCIRKWNYCKKSKDVIISSLHF